MSWLKKNSYHSEQFSINWLSQQKHKQKLTISLGIPTLNVESTIGPLLDICCRLKEESGLIDQIAVIDSYSRDKTLTIAQTYPVEIYNDAEILSQLPPAKGKGEALWKSLAVLKGDIIIWLDSDVYNFKPHFITGLIGPFFTNPQLVYVKAFYQRPLVNHKTKEEQALEGGRVTEILMRPMLNLFWPELKNVIQPLAGESAAKREALVTIPFFTDYAVEAGLLIHIYRRFGLNSIGQVNLGERVHSHQALSALGRMSFTIIYSLIKMLKQEGRLGYEDELPDTLRQFALKGTDFEVVDSKATVIERPPLVEVLAQKNQSAANHLSSDYFLV